VLIFTNHCLELIVIEKRQAEAARIRDKYPDRIPVWFHANFHWELSPFFIDVVLRFQHSVIFVASNTNFSV
jgi:hypothetical protein